MNKEYIKDIIALTLLALGITLATYLSLKLDLFY